MRSKDHFSYYISPTTHDRTDIRDARHELSGANRTTLAIAQLDTISAFRDRTLCLFLVVPLSVFLMPERLAECVGRGM